MLPGEAEALGQAHRPVERELVVDVCGEVRIHDERHDHERFEEEVVKLSIDNLKTFPWIAAAVRRKKLALRAFRFDIHNGVLQQLQRGRFAPVATG